MTSTSFQSGPADSRGTFEGICKVARSTSVGEEGNCPALSTVHATETMRMKAFVGQHKFQAPVADDFARGLLAPEPASHPDIQSLGQPTCRWAMLINYLTTRWRGPAAG